MTTQNQEGISLHPVLKVIVPNETFYAIVNKVKTEKTPSKKLAEEFNYSLGVISQIRSKAISMDLLERPLGVVRMMETIEKRKSLDITSARSYSQTTKQVNRNIKITTRLEKDSLPTSKFVNIKFGEMEVVVEKSASIVITKDKIIIN